jgi:carboxylate-amine ligase
LRAWPRSGAPRALRDFDDFCEMTRLLTRAADVPDYTWFWWKLRPHPRLGTVEIRALDAQTSLADTAALVALVQCLARDAAEAGPATDPPPELVEEGMFRAARFGVRGRIPDAGGALHAVPDVLDQAMARAREVAGELGCADELARLPDLVRRGGGAGSQRERYEIAGIDAVLRELIELTRGGGELVRAVGAAR